MEPNTSSCSAAVTSSAIVEQGRPTSAHGKRLFSSSSSFEPKSHGLIPLSGSGSGSPVVGDNSFLPSSSFLLAMPGTVHMSAEDMSNGLRAPVATSSTVALGGHLGPGLVPPPSWTTLGLPTSPRQGAPSWFVGQSMAALLEQMPVWPKREMSFLSPASGSSLPPWSSSINSFGFPQPASGSELAPLSASLRIPSLEEASTHNMLGTVGRAMPWHHDNLSVDVGSSISSLPNLTTGAMKAPMQLKPPSSQGACASNNVISFAAWPSSNSKLAALPASLEAPLMQEKKGPINATTVNRDPNLSLTKGEKYEVDKDNPNARDVSWESALKQPEDTRITRSTPCHHGSSSMGIDNSISTPKLSQPLPPSSLRAGPSSSRNPVRRVIFTDAEKEIIRKDKNLQELVNTEPKKVKRLLSNRISAAKRKAINDIHALELELKLETLESKYNTLFAEFQLQQEQCAEINKQNNEMSMLIQELERQATLKDALTEALQARIQGLKVMELNAVQMRSKKNKCPGCSYSPTK